jgi:hypothetical protein
MRGIKSVCGAMALAAMLVPSAHADDWNKKTFFTFSAPVQVPGTTLAAGTYTFKLADLSGNRHVIQIFDKSERKIYATLMAIPDQRMQPSDNPLVLFAERPAGSPVAVKAWFYPGETIGNEFIYPRKQAVAIAKRTHESVLASKSEKVEKTESVGHVNESDQMTPSGGNTVVVTPPPASTADTSASASRTTSARTVGTSGRTALPSTASELPLLGLLSGLSIAAGFGVRRVRRRLQDAA